MMGGSFANIAIVGLGLIGSSIARAARETMPGLRLSGWDGDEDVRRRAAELGRADMASDAAEAVRDADLVILCVPVGAMAEAAASIAGHLQPEAIVSDVGSSKAAVA